MNGGIHMTDNPAEMSGYRPDPAIMGGVIPSLSMDGRAAEAAQFYASAFAASEVGRYADQDNPGQLLHLHLEINGGSLMMTDCRAPWETETGPPRNVTMQLVVADGDAWWNRAVAAGCTVVMPFERQFWGDRFGLLRDPFGVEWGLDEPARA